jgi:hypothetical protein
MFEYKKISDQYLEIIIRDISPFEFLEELAKLSYELADYSAPFFVIPFEVPAERIDFKAYISDYGIELKTLNGKLLSTTVIIENGRYLFDSQTFKMDRGSPEAFLELLKARLNSFVKGPLGAHSPET